MKRKKLFSALMALAMILSLCTFASATADPVAALAPGTDNKDHMTISALGDTTGATKTVPASFASATIAYTATYVAADPTASPAVTESFDVTLGAFSDSTSGYSIAWKNSTTASLLGTTAAVIEFTKTGEPTFELTVTPDGKSPKTSITDGVITLGAAGEFRPAVVANTDGQLNSYANDSANGEVTNEGPLPPAIVNVKVPTDSETKHAFDLYLDPHDLIKDTSAARYGSGITASGDGRLYFKNSSTAMSNSSNALKIVNKSSVQVSVDLSVEATKGTNAFTFVNTAAGLDDATGAAIYLALKSGTTEKAIDDTAVNNKNTAKIKTSIDTGDWYDLTWHGPEKLGYYSYDMKSTLASSTNDDDFKSLTFNLTGKINDDDAWDSISSFGLSVIWDVKEYEAPPAPVAPTATVGTPFSGAGSTLSITLTWGANGAEKTKASITINGTDTEVTSPATTMTVTAPTNSIQYNNIPTAATVTFYDTAKTDADAVTVSVNVK